VAGRHADDAVDGDTDPVHAPATGVAPGTNNVRTTAAISGGAAVPAATFPARRGAGVCDETVLTPCGVGQITRIQPPDGDLAKTLIGEKQQGVIHRSLKVARY